MLRWALTISDSEGPNVMMAGENATRRLEDRRPGAGRPRGDFLQVHFSAAFTTVTTTSRLMPRRSSSPDSFKRYRDSDDGDRYRSRRGDTSGHRRSADPDSRDGPRDRRGVSERDTRRAYHDDDRRRRDDGDDDRRRRRDGYDSHGDDGRQRRRDESRDRRRYASRHDSRADDDRPGSRPAREKEYRDRGDRLRDGERERERRDRDRGDERRGPPPPRRSASPRRSRPHSRSRSRSASTPAVPPEDKAKPNFAPSGLLAAATNTVKNADGTSTLLKYNEPPEARKPVVGWRLYVFKDDKQVGAHLFFPLSILRLLLTRLFDVLLIGFAVDLLHIHRQSAYLIGRDRTVTDIPLEHPSCSKQHAVIQCIYLASSPLPWCALTRYLQTGSFNRRTNLAVQKAS